jgi:outer membrane protein assembly factor BamB
VLGLSTLSLDAVEVASAHGGPVEWTQYHGGALSTGVIPVSGVSQKGPAWTSPPLDGDLFGQPLVFEGRVYVATENDSVYALSSRTGRVLWRTHLGAPVPASDLSCGDITPTIGVTGTPVIDSVRHELFAVAFLRAGTRDVHRLVGLSTTTGAPRLAVSVDPPKARSTALLQRTALTLDRGSVVFGFGGNSGDCGPYRGRVVSVPETGGTPHFFTIDAAAHQREGAVWMGAAAPVIDAAGNIWVESGNGSVTSPSGPYDRSDAVLELDSHLSLRQYFAPSDWSVQNAADADLSTSPALMSDGSVIAAGKAGVAYLLSRTHLGGVGGELANVTACPGNMDGGIALRGRVAYLPCLGGLVAVTESLAPASIRVLWSSGEGGDSPVLTTTQVLTLSGDGTLLALNPATGHVESSLHLPRLANHFPTPGFGDGHLLVATARNVVALAAP